jgi:hypothetical protein
MSIPRIEKDIPIVEPGKYRRLNKYPWKNMELNDSFLFPNNTYPALAYTLCRQASHYNQPKKFITKRVVEEGVERFRVWRVL